MAPHGPCETPPLAFEFTAPQALARRGMSSLALPEKIAYSALADIPRLSILSS